jgi:hypothetical protein
MSNEIWKPIKGYESLYEISNRGTIRKINNKKLKMPHKHRMGYLKVMLYSNGKEKSFYLHRLIAKAFIPNPKNYPCVNHINGTKNDNSINNLEWCTRSQNTQHAYNTGLIKSGKNHVQSKALVVTDKNGNDVKILYGNNQWKAFGLDQASVIKCLKGIRKQHKGYTFRYLK